MYTSLILNWQTRLTEFMKESITEKPKAIRASDTLSDKGNRKIRITVTRKLTVTPRKISMIPSGNFATKLTKQQRAYDTGRIRWKSSGVGSSGD